MVSSPNMLVHKHFFFVDGGMFFFLANGNRHGLVRTRTSPPPPPPQLPTRVRHTSVQTGAPCSAVIYRYFRVVQAPRPSRRLIFFLSVTFFLFFLFAISFSTTAFVSGSTTVVAQDYPHGGSKGKGEKCRCECQSCGSKGRREV